MSTKFKLRNVLITEAMDKAALVLNKGNIVQCYQDKNQIYMRTDSSLDIYTWHNSNDGEWIKLNE